MLSWWPSRLSRRRCRRRHPKRPDFDLQAHAGGRGEATGESLRAFAKSLEIGVSTLELDIDITKDRQPLVWHDPIIDAGAVRRHRAGFRRRPVVSIRRKARARPEPGADPHAGLWQAEQPISRALKWCGATR